MFSKSFYTYTFKAVSLFRLFGVTSISFDRKTKIFRNDSRKQALFILSYPLLVSWDVIVLVIVLKSWFLEKDLNRFNISVSYFLGFLLTSSICSVSRWFSHDFCIACNGLFSLAKYFQNYLPREHNVEQNRFDKFLSGGLLLFITNMICCILLTVLILVYNPREIPFVGVLIPEEYYTYSVALLLVLLQVYLIVYAVLGITFVSLYVLVYSFTLLFIFSRELRLGRPRYMTMGTLRRPHDVRIAYRALQVLHKSFSCFIGPFLMIWHGCLIVAALYVNFVLIRYWSNLTAMIQVQLLLFSISEMGMWSICMEFFRIIFMNGNKLLNSWKGGKWGTRVENCFMKKFQRSCQPIVFGYGTQFVFKRVSVPNYYKTVVRGTWRALLSTKSN
ncbi:unnamed protein product [Orchesella dallaii]|uniref:Uncharacterized protein n=1 Tax=Orchesella dallaii TaxID=48710 RepID=A0ABP1QWC5_9HEXA